MFSFGERIITEMKQSEIGWLYMKDQVKTNKKCFGYEGKNVRFEKDQKVKIYVDDVRPVPNGYIGTKSVNETIALIEEIEDAGAIVELLDLDHDLGDYADDGGDAIKILDYLVEYDKYYPVEIHSANPVGVAYMERMIERYWP